MSVIPFSAGSCQKVLRYLDSYVSGELLVETNHEVLHHVESCPECRREYESRVRLRNSLRDAVRSSEVPAALRDQVKARLRAHGSRRFFDPRGWSLRQLGLIAASLLVMTAGILWLRHENSPLYLLNAAAQEGYIARVSAKLPGILRAAFGGHLHCTVARRYPGDFPEPANAIKNGALGPEFAKLTPIVQRLVPSGYRILLAHRCAYDDRGLIHFTFRRNDGKMLSLIVTGKQQGDSFEVDRLVPALRQAGVAVYQNGVDDYQVAGFESREYVAYVVSDLSERDNLQLAAAFAPAVREFLENVKG